MKLTIIVPVWGPRVKAAGTAMVTETGVEVAEGPRLVGQPVIVTVMPRAKP